MPASLRPTVLPADKRESVGQIIQERMALGERSLSYEFFPPKDDQASEDALWDSFEKLVSASADFVSVTYGAGGSNQEKSIRVLQKMAKRVLTVGHLTAVGATRAESETVLSAFLLSGVRSILALRGDAPKNNPDALSQGEIKRAVELVDLAFSHGGVEVGVAAFPEGHPESPDLEHDAKILKLKQDAGASYAITQLFFGVDHYLRLLEDSSRAGVTMPIIPGVMPIANAKQVLRMAQLSGAAMPTELLLQLESANPEDARRVGMDYTERLAGQLIEAGAPGLHIFTLNQSAPALEIARRVGLVP